MTERRSLLDELPGELILWVLIISELAVFGAGLLVFLSLRLMDPAGFAEAQDHLHRASAAINTVVLVTSGWCAARALAVVDQARACRVWLAGAMGLGALFLVLKGVEYADAFRQGIGLESGTFYTFYFLLTGFHAAHVLAGIAILALVAIRPTRSGVEAGSQFWHMVDLVWVLLFPVIYLLR
ncbi:MAG: cytochrome c oxidase subunit 3 [Paracoccus sp. (in: a-proteobacteria)]|uniref:cytochrome c oxidase subunit 3 n=1 Tax=Paracoccus sp. TaxID=267 RepID=UPI0026E0B904|nr:cytochrome c oxidase subunit 3 [Paracoccus sp. (in: a-proteobacteria)]MDO5620850.1 cytochrome c oxidase subunit 3 [Paracoccus sp. (in: a-proteobacteria)]